MYIFDRDKNRVILVDSETGKEVQHPSPHVTALIDYLRERGDEGSLRKFAIWCARQTEFEWKPIVRKIFLQAEEAAEGSIGAEELEALYDETEGAAISAESMGLTSDNREGPGFLAVRSCVHPNASQAALDASRFALLWAEMNFKHQQDDLGEDDEKQTWNNLRDKISQQQIDRLLELLSDEQQRASAREATATEAV